MFFWGVIRAEFSVGLNITIILNVSNPVKKIIPCQLSWMKSWVVDKNIKNHPFGLIAKLGGFCVYPNKTERATGHHNGIQ